VLNVATPALEAMSRAVYSRHLRRRAQSWRSPEQVRLRSDYLKLHTRSHRQSILDRFEEAMDDVLARAAHAEMPLRARVAGRR
jgi:hypothetical protein